MLDKNCYNYTMILVERGRVVSEIFHISDLV